MEVSRSPCVTSPWKQTEHGDWTAGGRSEACLRSGTSAHYVEEILLLRHGPCKAAPGPARRMSHTEEETPRRAGDGGEEEREEREERRKTGEAPKITTDS